MQNYGVNEYRLTKYVLD